MAEWGFYGRHEPLQTLQRYVDSNLWFFCRIQGRRRIGKTTLLGKLAEASPELGARLIYMQVPDSDQRDVAATFQRSLRESDFPGAHDLASKVVDFLSMSRVIGELCMAGAVVVLDEFQYFTRAALKPFNSFLQAEVDKLRTANPKGGGLFVLGSLQSEMNELLADKAAPLYGRLTGTIELSHWDFEDLLTVFRAHGVESPKSWLTFWTFFEGVPKFYHDAYVQNLFSTPEDDLPSELLKRMFLADGCPLSEEADTWFLRELRGKAVSVLHYLADHPGCSNAELQAAMTDGGGETAPGTQIMRLVNSYHMVDRRLPIFSNESSRNARYYITDNFLEAWLAVAKPAREFARLKPREKAVALALPRLETLEGFAFEKLIRQLHLETSKKGAGDFELSELKLGYWNRPRDVSKCIEIDLVALDEQNKRIRFGSCKRSATAHDGKSLKKFADHVDGFLSAREHKKLREWEREMALFSPSFDGERRDNLEAAGYVCRDLNDYSRFLGNKMN